MKAILQAIVCLLIATIAFADDCNINLKAGVNYQDLNVAFSCLANKIEVLEREVKALKRYDSVHSGGKKSSSLLENQFLSVYDYRIFKDNRGVSLTFVVLNKSSKGLLLAILHNSPVLNDERGHSFGDEKIIGLGDVGRGNESEQQRYAVLSPGVPTTVTVVFNAERFSSEMASFNMTLLQVNNDKVERYSIGQRNIVVEN